MHRLLIVLVLIFLSGLAFAQEQSFGVVEKKGVYLPDSVFVLNEDSVAVELNLLIDKPTLLSFVYYHCPTLCPKVMSGISELVNFSESIPSEDYQLITISIDHEESSLLARETKNRYYQMIEKPVNKYFWRFFTADSNTIRKLTESVGWEFRRVGDDFVHTTSSILITPEAMVSQYFYGSYFNYMHFDLSVEKAAMEETMPTRLKTLKYCYNYKPAKNNILVIITTSFGIAVILVMLTFFLIMLIKR